VTVALSDKQAELFRRAIDDHRKLEKLTTRCELLGSRSSSTPSKDLARKEFLGNAMHVCKQVNYRRASRRDSHLLCRGVSTVFQNTTAITNPLWKLFVASFSGVLKVEPSAILTDREPARKRTHENSIKLLII
jgi:hypothetical protein